MRLKITQDDGTRSFHIGNAAHLYLDDIDISQYVTKCELVVDSESAIKAIITILPTSLDIDLPYSDIIFTPLGEWPVQHA